MLTNFAKKIFGSANERRLKSFYPVIAEINALEPKIKGLSDKELQAQTDKLRGRLNSGETLDDILPEAFATLREAAKRVIGLRAFDVQLLGGMILHHGMIAEMKTGEGKTLVATFPSYLNAISGKGVHVVTVNDYLARRDSGWMGQIHAFLGLNVGCIVHELTDEERKAAYACDITYGTNNEFGFDYLRDNMKFSLSEMVQRPFNYAIVDEVDSILIDEARTPLIISGPTEDNSALYISINKYIPRLAKSDYEIDEKARTVTLSEEGTHNIEALLKKDGLVGANESLYDLAHISLVHHINQALKAHTLFTRDKDYIVKDRKVIIIDEFTGRMMEGRRYSEGLHQALEAKENVPIQNENQTLASITFQNYFRLYPKLSGMTGTAMTEANEFGDIYRLEVTEVPTHVPVARRDEDDMIFRTAAEKYDAIVKLIKECNERQQPVLVGTVSIEKSEYLSDFLKKQKIPHNVLNARYHEKEASIISQAGRPGAVTIATNMAGRGTDIMLGGNPDMLAREQVESITDEAKIESITKKVREQVAADKKKVLEAGGLCVIGTERHESRRIDNQLRGRSGRQGDPGLSRFFLSLEDDLMRIFGSEKIDGLLLRLGLKEGESIQHPWMNKALEKAQKKVEDRNYEIRKNLLKFDDVMNDQRKVVFEQRKELMKAESVEDTVRNMREETLENAVASHIPENSYLEQWDIKGLEKEIFRIFGLNLLISAWAAEEGIADKEIYERILAEVNKLTQAKETAYGKEILRSVEKNVLLYTLDQLWKDHLLSLDQLRQGISLRAYGQKDPLNEYKREAFEMFEVMLSHMREQVTHRLSHIEIHSESSVQMTPQPRRMVESRVDPATAREEGKVTPLKPSGPFDANDPNSWSKTGRNDACPCGSGKKYKHCHGTIKN